MIGKQKSTFVFTGLDFGEGEHYAFAMDRAGKWLFDKLTQDSFHPG